MRIKASHFVLACVSFCGLCLRAGPALAEDEIIPPLADSSQKKIFNTGSDFFDQAELGGGLYYFQRKRDRYDSVAGKWEDNLDHGTVQAATHFDSGFAGEGAQAGLDLGYYFSYDVYNNASPDHEMNFFPWDNPWKPDWSRRDTNNGGNIYKANFKFRYGPEEERLWFRAGYLQPQGPGTLGVNWSILPGTYRGLESGFSYGSPDAEQGHGKLDLAFILADKYKAPWFKDFYSFRKLDGTSRIAYLWSAGARYSRYLPGASGGVPGLLTLEAAYGESEGYLRNFHFKAGYSRPLGPGNLELKYQFYGMLDNERSGVNDNFSGLARQHYLGVFYNVELWKTRLEYTYTVATQNSPDQLGYFAYRLTNPSGSSKGAYDIWWDARSDWNHDRESAVFLGVTRALDDLGLPGWSAGLSGAAGFNGQAHGYSGQLKEYAWNADISYVRRAEPLKGASAGLHYTWYVNASKLPSWVGYKNAFQDERDIKLLLCVPF